MWSWMRNIAYGATTTTVSVAAGSWIGGTSLGCAKYTLSNKHDSTERLLETRDGIVSGSKYGVIAGALSGFLHLRINDKPALSHIAAFIAMPLLVIAHYEARQYLPMLSKTYQKQRFHQSEETSEQLRRAHDENDFEPAESSEPTDTVSSTRPDRATVAG